MSDIKIQFPVERLGINVGILQKKAMTVN